MHYKSLTLVKVKTTYNLKKNRRSKKHKLVMLFHLVQYYVITPKFVL